MTETLAPLHSGKVRDLYRTPDGGLLMVASDRISAFDFILSTPIPDKGRILTALSVWWFEQLGDIVPNHLISVDDPSIPPEFRGRAMLCQPLDMVLVEAVARGYLTGSGLIDYNRTGAVCGVSLPGGLVDGDRLPEPIFTPASKAALGEHDENVTYEAVAAEVGEATASELRRLTLAIYERAASIAAARASCSPTPSSSSDGRRTARSCWPTRCSPPTRPASGRPTTGSPDGRRPATTSSTCATGCCRPRRAGTARPAKSRRACPRT